MRIAICDDDEKERDQCRQTIEELAKAHNLEVEFDLYTSGKELLFHIEDVERYADIIYLDMSMEDKNGEDVAYRLRERGCNSELIFFTVSKQHYESAFDVRAFHYIVKGSTPDYKFEEIFLSAVREAQKKHKEYILCAGAGEYRHIEVRSIRYFTIVKRIVTVCYGKKDEFSFYSTFGKIENKLKDYGFVRVHRSYLVAIGQIRTINNHEVTLQSGETIPIGRIYYADVKEAMDQYSGKE